MNYCEHNDRRAYRAQGDTRAFHWMCDKCGDVEAMTPAEIEFTAGSYV